MFESVNETATEYVFVRNPHYWGEKPEVDSFCVFSVSFARISDLKENSFQVIRIIIKNVFVIFKKFI